MEYEIEKIQAYIEDIHTYRRSIIGIWNAYKNMKQEKKPLVIWVLHICNNIFECTVVFCVISRYLRKADLKVDSLEGSEQLGGGFSWVY